MPEPPGVRTETTSRVRGQTEVCQQNVDGREKWSRRTGRETETFESSKNSPKTLLGGHSYVQDSNTHPVTSEHP